MSPPSLINNHYLCGYMPKTNLLRLPGICHHKALAPHRQRAVENSGHYNKYLFVIGKV